MILIPGITSPAITWGFVAERLGAQFDTYVLDVRGRGLSSTGPELDYSADTCADDIGAFADALNLDSYHLMGHSMGARFALRSAVMHPRGVKRVVLIDPPVSGPGRREYPSKLRGTSIRSANPWLAWTPRQCAPSAPPGPTNNCNCVPNGCTPVLSPPSCAPSMISTPWISTRTCPTSRPRAC
nr:alpha/beta hydrolase [Pseudomonas allii]